MVGEPRDYPFGATRGSEERPLVIRGRRYLHLTAAARVIEEITRPTLQRWAEQGHTSWGLRLEHYNHCGTKSFIPEKQVQQIRKYFEKQAKRRISKSSPHP